MKGVEGSTVGAYVVHFETVSFSSDGVLLRMIMTLSCLEPLVHSSTWFDDRHMPKCAKGDVNPADYISRHTSEISYKSCHVQQNLLASSTALQRANEGGWI